MANFEHAVHITAITQPFFATILLQQNRVADESIDTMCVDGTTLRWNPRWVAGLEESHCQGVIIHECMHLALKHPVWLKKLSQSDPNFSENIAQLAMDFVINALILEDRSVRLPGGCTPEIWQELVTKHNIPATKPLRDMTVDEVYYLLMNHLPKDESGGGKSTAGQDVMPCPGDTITADADLTTLANSAYATAKQAGNVPGYIEELMGKLNAPQVNWKAQLWQFVSEARNTGYTFTRPNRRYAGSRVIMPSFGAKGLPALNCIFDSSGSVSGAEFTQFLSELNGAAESLGIKDIICVVCDTEVQAVHHRSVSEGEITFAAKGRGGTILDPAFEELERHRPAPTVCFSDGYFSAPPQPRGPVVWCLTSDKRFSYGKHIRITA